MKALTSILLTASLVSTGLMAGIFLAFTTAVMPGLRATDDRTFVAAMQQFNAAIQNGLFFLVFLGALVFPIAAAVLRARAGEPYLWIAIAAGLYLVVLILTMGISVPLNNALAGASLADAARARADFEGVWVPVNNVRTILSTLALLCLGHVMVAGWTR
ncbi:anthrone oxygenase family protein [Actinoplanes regularis]|uniref:Uncharacterized membrane protein n=1 Tax=Actinoplanes regularis TaxID=52697 RepID=A0A238Y725_9ACTN|nr:anthrone oxygenase family protein [Actinoplanes regularis]GIE86117.1 membrane protein [Actinoplanes regularis]SNR67076.1 Uncharacterized membrane protein [Actinoplanes regularis]